MNSLGIMETMLTAYDVMIVGNHHAREWMSYTVAVMQMEVIAFSYNNIGYDNDGDGLVDEDPWGDANNDGILDDDGDCLALRSDLKIPIKMELLAALEIMVSTRITLNNSLQTS